MSDAAVIEKAPTQPAPDPDAAKYAEMARELSDAPAQNEKPAEAAKTEAEKPAEKAPEKPQPLPYEELDKRHKNLQAALGEARLEARQLRERQAAAEAEAKRMSEFLRTLAEGQTRNQPDADPYLDPVRKQVETIAEQAARLEKETQAQKQAIEARRQQEELMNYVTRAEREFAAQTPDYTNAVTFLREHRQQEYAAMFPDGHPKVEDLAIQNGFRTAAEFRQALVERDAMNIAVHAAQTGMSPAELAYNIARQRGYAPRAAAPVAQPAPQPVAQRPAAPSRIETIRAGQQAASSLSTGSGGTPADGAWPTIGELANMYTTDPDKAESILQKMRAAGVLN